MSTTKDGQAGHQAYESITLTLNRIDCQDDVALAVRTIHLNDSEPKVTVGRSSKTVSKGLMPAPNNAYFDVPVMSRRHAEFEANLAEGTLLVTDTGSLHGTSINNSQLAKDDSCTLKSGDIVRFGTHVARGLEVFSPVGVRIEFSAVEAKKPHMEETRSYQAPEYADEISDAASECECSDDHNHSNTDESFARDSDDVAAVIGISDSDGESAEFSPSLYDHPAASTEDEDLGRRGSIYLADYDEEISDDSGADDEDEPSSDDDDLQVISALPEPDLLSVDSDGDYFDDGEQDIGDDEVDEDEDKEGAEDHESTAPEHVENPTNSQDMGDYLMNQIARYDAIVDGYLTPQNFSTSSKDNDDLDNTGADIGDQADQADMTMGFEETPRHAEEPAVVPEVVPVVTNRLNISSILNPSEPLPAHEQPSDTANNVTAVAAAMEETILHESNSWQGTCSLPTFNESEKVSPCVRAMAGTGLDCRRPSQKSALLESGKIFLNSAPKEALSSGNTDDYEENVVMESAATFHKFKKQQAKKADKATRKRKAEDLYDDVNEYILESSSSLGSKRQATAASILANRKPKSYLWAVAEKMGIAALGGAVVLGSLIYTAPSF